MILFQSKLFGFPIGYFAPFLTRLNVSYFSSPLFAVRLVSCDACPDFTEKISGHFIRTAPSVQDCHTEGTESLPSNNAKSEVCEYRQWFLLLLPAPSPNVVIYESKPQNKTTR